MLRFTLVIDVDTNTAETATSVRDAIAKLLHPLETERGWRVNVWPAEPRERDQ